MSGEIDPKDMAAAMIDEDGRIGGAKKFCIRGKQCIRATTCEHVQKRNRTVVVEDLFDGRAENLADCANWKPREELCSQGDVPRRRSGSGSRHNAHAPDRTRAREALGFYNAPDLTKLGGSKDPAAYSPSLILPPHLRTKPDLNVTRHIKDGKDINGDD